MTRTPASAEAPADMRSFRSWAGVIVGPLAWVLQLVLDWGLSEVVACAPATRPPPSILGLPLQTTLLVITLVLLAATILSGLGAWRRLRRLDPSEHRLEHFVAVAGVMTAVLFTIVISAGILPIHLTQGCLP